MEQKDYRDAFDALSFSAGFEEKTAELLLRRARELEKERMNMTFGKTKKLAVLAAACAALLVVSVSAAVLLMPPDQVAEESSQPLIAEAFKGPDAILVNETVESGDYSITLMGLVSGQGLNALDPEADEARTYAVLALRRLDGTPLETQTFNFIQYTMTPLVAGYSPAAVNNWTLNAGAHGFAKDGIYYYLLDTQSIEMFADHTVYIAFYEGMAPNNMIFFVNDDGTIQFCDDFSGVHALFTLPLDPAKADPAAVESFLGEYPIGWSNDRTLSEELSPRLQEMDNGKLVTITPTVPETGVPYSLEEFEALLPERQKNAAISLARGKMTQEDYDEWTQRQERILSGLRDGSITGLQGERGYFYFNDLPENGEPLAPMSRDEGEPLTYATAAEFKAYMEEEKAGLQKQLEDGAIPQETYEQSVQDLEDILAGIQDGTMVAAFLDNGTVFAGWAPNDMLEYRLASDGTVISIFKNQE